MAKSRTARANEREERGGREFVARTISGVTVTIEGAIFDQEQASLPGLLQAVDARAKVVVAMVLLAAIGLAHHIEVILVACAVALLLASFSRLALRPFVRRAWLGIPLFAAVVVVPSVFMMPGNPVLELRMPLLSLTVTDNALYGAALFVTRVGASVSIALLLISTTRWTNLLRALGVLKMPEGMVVVLGMTYRYLFLFLHAANNLFLARASRTVGVTSGSEQRRWAAGAASTLLSRSVKMSGDVLLSMQARGFTGEIRTSADGRMKDQDWLCLALGVALAGGLLLLDRGLR